MRHQGHGGTMHGAEGMQIGNITAFAGLAMFAGAVWLVIKYPLLALFVAAVAVPLAFVGWLLFHDDLNLMAHPLFGLVVLVIGATIGTKSRKKEGK